MEPERFIPVPEPTFKIIPNPDPATDPTLKLTPEEKKFTWGYSNTANLHVFIKKKGIYIKDIKDEFPLIYSFSRKI